MKKKMTSMERVVTAMSMQEPDRVPLFLLGTHYCAKFFDMTVKAYFSKPQNVVKGQLRLLEKFGNDCLNPFYSVAHEVAAFGSEIVFYDEGPPNVGEPIIKNIEDVLKMEPPSIQNSKTLLASLETIASLKAQVGSTVPIGGAVLAPFTLPIVQLGFEKYIELIYERPDLLTHLLKVNEQFCTEWANSQLKAGATFITITDSMATSSILPKEIYLKTGFESAKRTLPKINSAVALATSSVSSATILEEVLETGVKAILVSHGDDLAEVKAKVNKRATLLGNLNGIEMCRWTKEDVQIHVKEAIKKAGSGGGFILCDSLGDLPYQVKEETLYEVSEAVNLWGRYPL